MPVDGSGLARMIAEKPLTAAPRGSYRYMPMRSRSPSSPGPGSSTAPQQGPGLTKSPTGNDSTLSTRPSLFGQEPAAFGHFETKQPRDAARGCKHRE